MVMMMLNHPLLVVMTGIIVQSIRERPRKKPRPESKEEKGKRSNMMESDGFNALMMTLDKDR